MRPTRVTLTLPGSLGRLPRSRLTQQVPSPAGLAYDPYRAAPSSKPSTPPPASPASPHATPGALAKDNPAAVLARYMANPLEFSNKVVPAAINSISRLDGRGLANLLATSALLGDFNPALFWEASKVLRSLTFDSESQALLGLVSVALGLASPGLASSIPRDIAAHCLKAHNAGVTKLQPVYDIVALALRRSGLPYAYRAIQPETGLLLWLQLPTPATQAAADAWAAAGRSGQRGPSVGGEGEPDATLHAQASARAPWSSSSSSRGFAFFNLEVGGEWDTFPVIVASGAGSSSTPPPAERSLACRLHSSILAQVGVGTLRMTPEERGRFMGPDGAAAIDLRRGDPGYEDRYWDDDWVSGAARASTGSSASSVGESGGFPSAASSATWKSPLQAAKAARRAAAEAAARATATGEDAPGFGAGYGTAGGASGTSSSSSGGPTAALPGADVPRTRDACRTLAQFVSWAAIYGVRGEGV